MSHNLGCNKVLSFAQEMQKELINNDHKGGWDNCTLCYLLRRLKEEVKELEQAIAKQKSEEDVISECADIANFSMMIGDKYEK